jgi:hypothetical protein
MDQDPILLAILAAINAALTAEAVTLPDFTDVRAFDLDSVPGTFGNDGPVPPTHVVARLQRIKTDTRRFGGDYTVPGFFLDTSYRSQSAQGCRALRRVVSEALENQFVGTYGPFVFNDESQPIDDDADWGFLGVDTWQFC